MLIKQKLHFKTLFLLITSLLSHHSIANTKTHFEELFSTSVVLTDSETITLGVGNFDPEKLLKPHEKSFSESDSIKLRNELTVYSIPYTWRLTDEKSEDKTKDMVTKEKSNYFYLDELTVSLSYLKQENKNICHSPFCCSYNHRNNFSSDGITNFVSTVRGICTINSDHEYSINTIYFEPTLCF